MEDLLRRIPQISRIMEHFRERYPLRLVSRAAREVTDRYRREIREGRRSDVENLLRDVEKKIRELMETSLRRVVNATGVVVNTNLGRAPLHPEVASFLEEIATGYSNLEYDLAEGERRRREKHVEAYLLELTGAQSALVVNNNAAAVFLVLNSLAAGREVVISRGELVEIGGGFRIPDIMRSSGAILREVGTTNRTKPSDYETAVGDGTALVMKVHRSNFYMEGFVEEVSLGELASLAKSRGVPLYYDCGSGLLVDLGLGAGERTFRKSLEEGADVVSGSGDKLLGGPQAGVIVGRRDLLESMRRNPLMRVLRVDKLTLAGLEMTLKLYREGRQGEIPVIRMLTEDPETLRRRAHRLSRLLKGLKGLKVRVIRDVSRPGGGAFPELELPTYCVCLEHPEITAGDLSRRLRGSEPPVVGRIRRDTLLLDVRTIGEEEIRGVAQAVRRVLEAGESSSDRS